MVHFYNAMGQSPLHLAADWPWATALLLKNGADPYQADSHRYTAIDYACRLENYEVVKILLEEGSPLPDKGPLGEIITCEVTWCFRSFPQRIFKLIISHLVIRRRELLRIARTLLPEATLNEIMPPNEAVPDLSAHQLITAVRTAGHATKPDSWYYDVSGLYHSAFMIPAAADMLYEAGFTYLEGRDRRGRTPLATTRESGRIPAMIVWLYRRSVSFAEWTSGKDKSCSAPFMPSMYLAIKGLAQSIYEKASWEEHYLINSRVLSEDDSEALNIILQDKFSDFRDFCQCPCSSGGCSPEIIMLKTILMRIKEHMRFHPPKKRPLPAFIQLVDDILVAFNGKLTSSSFIRLSQAAIPMALFLDLGIRHTCCKLGWSKKIPPTCQEEIDEIREEDRLPRERFEALLPKAQSAWEKSSERFTDFWREFHRVHICRQHYEPVDEVDLEKKRELGVVLHERGDEETYCDSLYGDEVKYCESLFEDDEGHCDSMGSEEQLFYAGTLTRNTERPKYQSLLWQRKR